MLHSPTEHGDDATHGDASEHGDDAAVSTIGGSARAATDAAGDAAADPTWTAINTRATDPTNGSTASIVVCDRTKWRARWSIDPNKCEWTYDKLSNTNGHGAWSIVSTTNLVQACIYI